MVYRNIACIVSISSLTVINPFYALVASYDVHRKVFPMFQRDVRGRPARIPTSHVCSEEAEF